MGKNRYINTHFWDDSYISSIDPIEKLIFLYVLTNPLTSISGCYEITLKRMASDTGIDKDMIIKIIDRFTTDGKMLYLDNWLCIKNFVKHQKLNPNIEKGIDVAIKKVPEEVMKAFKSLPKASNYINLNSNLNSNLNINTNTNTKENDNKETDKKALLVTEDFYKDLTDIVNPTRLATNKPCLKSWSNHIRLLHTKDGVEYKDMKEVWLWAFKDSFWYKNILSTEKFRKQYDRLHLGMQKRGNTPVEDEVKHLTVDQLRAKGKL